jgi:SAM-dependent methyltransferase
MISCTGFGSTKPSSRFGSWISLVVTLEPLSTRSRERKVVHYHGIDLSQAALDLASKTLEALDCPVTLEHRDFVAAMRDRPEPVDVAWISLSLHHLLAPAKLSLMREIRNVVGDRGLFLIYENATPDGEDRDAHLLRWERHYQLCTALPVRK